MSTPAHELDLAHFRNIEHEPILLHPPERGGRVAICTSLPPRPGQKRRPWTQRFVDVAQLPAQLAELRPLMRDDYSYYISQHTLTKHAEARAHADHEWLNALWVDLDLGKSDYSQGYGDYSQHLLPSRAREVSRPLSDAPDALAALLLLHLRELGLPEPSWITCSGCGLHVKWLLAKPLQAAPGRVARWEQIEAELVNQISRHAWREGDAPRRWPVDLGAKDVPRVLRLVGSINHVSGTACRVLWTGQRVALDDMASALRVDADKQLVLPKLAQVRKEIQASNYADQMVVQPAAREAAPAPSSTAPEPQRAKKKRHAKPRHAAPMTHEAATAMWRRRLAFGRAVLHERGGAAEGRRNDLFWPLALAVAWTASDRGELLARLDELRQELFCGEVVKWTMDEALASANSILSRWDAGELYRMPQRRWLGHLGVTAQERAANWRLLAPTRDCNVGAMGLPTLPKGVPLHEHAESVRQRQSLAAAHAVAESLKRRYIDCRGRSIAKQRVWELFSQGETPTRISRVVHVPRKTVHDWVADMRHGAAWAAWNHAEAAAAAAHEQAKELRAADVLAALKARGRNGGGGGGESNS